MQTATRKSRFQAIIDLVKGAALPGLFPRGKGDIVSNAMSAESATTLPAISEHDLKNPPTGAGGVDPVAR